MLHQAHAYWRDQKLSVNIIIIIIIIWQQVEVFGRPLNQGEIDRLPQAKQEEACDRIMEIIQRRLQERRQQQLNSGLI